MVKDLNENISKQISNNLNNYSEKIIELQYSLQPELIIKYNKLQKDKFLEDIKSTLNFLSVSIRVGSKELYFSYIRWLTKLVKKIKIPMEEILVNFQCIKEVINSEIVLESIKEIDEKFKKYTEISELSYGIIEIVSGQIDNDFSIDSYLKVADENMYLFKRNKKKSVFYN
ncbi:hypothetical protein [Clostridium saccharoperbutylacetonicum]|uniref:Uncharacterized protein n=1 Tax=Clostridium saccharoperbutylacetonicum N1-4(HMT) TaxID=931276 RepID=M1MN14_9CLOT|nr:hypothetical protein [Clostridium saccharoperbutylacetonicum]AGF57608.1 hypothetical protein Cspa_c38480 [Clostridium saccharoperbutylacetonicum N1-4(HMT)]AQR96301.1 hypothetical protein CLSAP_36220 [Clostridium saccharoperbutylacetonicum]NRT61624.1 hypothetical protein [Clostridium saccharoperbutylacetonicum]NSB24947.1 hypothetical protein [Clostridium saccharoperbutylacetonicum]NSB32174.1 hypothetical protein [Clostridium saccharoperbutylacetonicum]